MFENFNVRSMYLAPQELLSLYASARTTGLVLKSGYGITHAIPIDEGYINPQAVKTLNIGGRDLTEYLTKLLGTHHGFVATTNAEKDIVNDIKEKSCVVASSDSDVVQSKRTSNVPEAQTQYEQPYELPDGKLLNIEDVRYRCPEALFDPTKLGEECEGIHKIIYNSIMGCDCNIRMGLCANILLSGGNTMFQVNHLLQLVY